MIKKLKIKFILTNMVLITLVMVACFAIMYYNSANDLEKSSIEAMRDIASTEQAPPPMNGLFDKDRNKNKVSKYPNLSTYTYILDIDLKNNKYRVSGYDDSDHLTSEEIEQLTDIIGLVRGKDRELGILEEYNMRFFCTKTPFGDRIVLLDKSYEDNSLNQLLLSFVLSGSLAFVAFLAISILIASIAIKPIETSIKQQHQLVSDMSHELKTPITVISTNTDIILSHDESTVEEEKKWLGYIKEETARMTELINMMLYLAKSDEADTRPELREIDLSSIAYEIGLPFESFCYENGKTFNCNITNDLFIKGDETGIKQLLAILLDNAIKYSNTNGLIELSVQQNADKAIVTVFNTGEAIPQEHIPHIFERFYRVDKARSRESGGSGLGLSIAKSIIEANEGSIDVTSNENKGTAFICTFKLIKPKKKQNDNKKITSA